jgi:hypothetical protein
MQEGIRVAGGKWPRYRHRDRRGSPKRSDMSLAPRASLSDTLASAEHRARLVSADDCWPLEDLSESKPFGNMLSTLLQAVATNRRRMDRCLQ